MSASEAADRWARSPRRRLRALRDLRGALEGRRDVDWDGVLTLAGELRIAPALWAELRADADRLPDHTREQLRHEHSINTARNLRFRHGLRRVVEALNGAGVTPLLFKGGLALVDGTVAELGDRWMIDLDLAVPAEQLSSAAGALERLGYERHPAKPFLHPHETPFFRRRTSGPLELHTDLGSPPVSAVLPIREAWAAGVELTIGSGRARGLCPQHQVLHNVLHSAVQDLEHAVGGLPLRQLMVLSALVRVHGARLDWAAMQRRMADHGLDRQLRDHLWLAHRFCAMPLPERRWGPRPRVHEARVLAGFALGWPADLQRNLHHAFGRAYLDALYGHGDRPLLLAAARIRHAVAVLRRDGGQALAEALARRP